MPGTTDKEVYLGSPDNPKTAAVVCYITLIGWLIAYFALYKNAKTSLAAYHLRQTLLLYIFLFAVNSLIYVATKAFIISLDFIWFILWLMGFFNAIYERQKPMPIIGKWSQKLFKKL